MDQQFPADVRPPPAPIILVLDAHACVTWSSGPVEGVFGRQPSELVAAPVSMLIDDLSFCERVATVDLLHADGSRRRAVVQIDPWRASNAQFFAIIIPASESKLQPPAAEEPHFVDGSFSIDAVTREVRWSADMARLHAVDPSAAPADIPSMLSHIAPADREPARTAIERALRDKEALDVKWTTEKGERVIRVYGWTTLAHGRLSRLFGSALDVTEDEAAERERRDLARDSDETRRMTSLGRVAATMAHEFNNVLAGIGSFAEYLVRRAPDDDSRRAAANIRHAIHRGKRVTDEILRYTRATRPKMGLIDVRGWLEAFMPEGTALTNGRVTLEANESLSIRGDVAQLNQVLVNLVINARDASASDMPIEIRAGISTATREGVRVLDLAVIDHGTGIPPDVRERIFEPLFTTKPSGTGLGLPLVDQVVHAHGGVVRVRSEMGKGSEFHVLIPLYEGEAKQGRVTSVLIADDNEDFADGTKELLTMEGFHARVVYRAADVIPALEQEAAEALVLDIGLPDMAGTDVYAAIIDRWPDLPVVFVSGHRTRDLERLLRQRHVAFLEKPFDLDDLLDALRRVTTAAA